MVPIVSLWLAILLSAMIVFIVTSVIHMFLTYHRSDFGKVPSEDAVMDALGSFDIPPGDYVIPRAESTREMSSSEFVDKCTKGPVAFLTVTLNGPPPMTSRQNLRFLYCVLVGIGSAYVAGNALGPSVACLEPISLRRHRTFLEHLQFTLSISDEYYDNGR